MRKVFVFRHAPSEGPGYLAEWLDRRGVAHELIAVDEGAAVPRDPREAGALVFMGGPMSANDPLPWIADELALIRRARDLEVPVLGHCLGAQLIAKALGGCVSRCAEKEIGWFPVRAAPTAAAADAVAEGWLPESFEAFHWHGESVTLPPASAWLMRSDACAHQAFSVARCLGLQFHVEMTASMVRAWAREGRAEVDAARAAGHCPVEDPRSMLVRLAERIGALHRVADGLYGAWLERRSWIRGS